MPVNQVLNYAYRQGQLTAKGFKTLHQINYMLVGNAV